ncbi:MAG: hypothetical protein M8467_02865 [Anaerolineae bacterium]|nr:hypothetical protein [Anaerolineae bacterium]
MKVFIAGIMQGSRLDRDIDDQGYRAQITTAILQRYPGSEIVDPNELHPEGVGYDDEQARSTLLEMAALAAECDLLVAYAPQASMGTAIEMWQAFQAGAPIVTISPMSENWVVKHLSDAMVPDLAAFRAWVAGGGLQQIAGAEAAVSAARKD